MMIVHSGLWRKLAQKNRGVVAQQTAINIAAKNMTEAEKLDEDIQMLRPFQFQ